MGLLALLFLLPPADPRPDGGLVIRGITVIEPSSATRRAGATIVVEHGRITRVEPSATCPVPPGSRTLDGAGLFAIPGLWDMHVHALGARGVELDFPLLVANGVTGVRDMNTELALDEAHRLRTEVEEGRLLGPWFVTSGPMLDGPGRPASALGANVLAVATVDEARAAVRKLHGAGADFVKVYNRLTLELYDAVLSEARSLGVPVDGHVPLQVSAWRAAEAGQRSLEHLYGVLEACATNESELLEATRALVRDERNPELVLRVLADRRAVLDALDESRAREFFALLRARETWICPTLVSNRALALRPENGTRLPALERYVAAESRATWSWRAPPEGEEHASRRYERLLETVAAMHRAGVPLLAGTDLGVPYVYAGASLHAELALLVEAGVPAAAALEAATSAPARFLGLADRGAIAAGMRADVVLLEADPLADIGNTRRIHAVVLGGKLLERADIERMLARVEAAAREKQR